MAIGYTNTDTTGFTTFYGGSGTWSDSTLATPSNAAASTLLVAAFLSSYPTSRSAYTVSLANVSGETEIGSGISITGATHEVDAHAYYALLASSPTNINPTASPSEELRRTAVALIITGHDTGTPIRDYATNSGTGQTVTFPNTGSVSDGDMVIRVCHVGKEDTNLTFGAVSGVTLISAEDVSGAYYGAMYCGYSIKSGAGTPGTATSALTVSGNRDWVAMTIVVAVAGGSEDVAAAGSLSITGAAVLNAAGSLVAAGAASIAGAAILSATGALLVAGSISIAGAADLDARGTLAAAGAVSITGAADLTSTVVEDIAATGSLSITGSADLDAIGSLAASGSVIIAGAADLTSTATEDIAAVGSLSITGVAALRALGNLTAAGALSITGAATLIDAGSNFAVYVWERTA